MKKLFGLVLALLICTATFIAPPAVATPDLALGRNVFNGNCVACHLGGKNSLNAQKTLQKDVLEKYDMYSAEAIITQVTNGKRAMPAFGSRLSADQIESVAAYVLAQSEAGW